MSLPGGNDLCLYPDTGSCIFCQHLAPIDWEISRTTTKMESLLAQREELNRNLGRLCHKALVHRMPPEIISKIFEIYVEDWRAMMSNGYGPLFLGAICRPWRQLAWKKPDLWTRLDFRFTPEVSFNSFHLAHDWLSRTGNLPLSIRLYHDDEKTDTFPHVCHAFVQTILSKYGPRCRSISLTLPSKTLSAIEYISSPESSILQLLELASTDMESIDASGPLNAGHYLSPSTLTLKKLVLSEVSIDFQKLTSFTGDHMFLGEVVQILKMAPLLRSCTQRSVFREFLSWNHTIVMEPLVSNHLEVFDVDFCCEKRNVERFFAKVKFPRLRNFTCSFCADFFPVEAFVAFIKRSSCSLQQVSLECLPISGQGLIDIAESSPSITEFSMSNLIQPTSSPLVSSFYHALSIGVSSGDGISGSTVEGSGVLLPILQKLYISPGYGGFDWQLLPGFFGAFGTQDNVRTRPLKEVEISCVDTHEANSESFNFYEIPFIRRDTLGDLLQLEDVDLKLHYRPNPSAPPRDIIKATIHFHEMIERARLYGPEFLHP